MEFTFEELAMMENALTDKIINLEDRIAEYESRDEELFRYKGKEEYIEMLSRHLSLCQSSYEKVSAIKTALGHQITLYERR
jgi:hypothetical protein